MNDEISTEPTIETVEDTATQEVVDDNREYIDSLSDEEFDKHLDTLTTEDSENEQPKEVDDKKDESKDLDDLEMKYKEQLEKGFKLEEPILVKVDGKVLDIDDPNDVKSLIEKGLDYTKKTQELAQYRETLKFLDENGISNVETLQQVLSGQIQVDPAQIQQRVDPTEQQVNQVAEQILQSEYADDMRQIMHSLPTTTKEEFTNNPQMLQGLFVDVQSGFAQKVLPLAQKYMTINGLPFVEAYIKAGNAVSQKSDTNKQKITSEPRSKGMTQKRSYTREDIYGMSEAEFDKYLSKL